MTKKNSKIGYALICCSLFFLFSSPLLVAYPKILFLGDSLTEGLGVEKEEAYPALVIELLQKNGYPQATAVNAGVSGSTSASGPGRMKWYNNQSFDYVVLALGANDGLRGIDPKSTKKHLASTIQLIQQQGAKTILAGMHVPMNYGKEYQQSFYATFLELQKEWNIPLYPFLLEGVALEPAYNQADGIHPNIKGHQKIAAQFGPWLIEQIKKFDNQ